MKQLAVTVDVSGQAIGPLFSGQELASNLPPKENHVHVECIFLRTRQSAYLCECTVGLAAWEVLFQFRGETKVELKQKLAILGHISAP